MLTKTASPVESATNPKAIGQKVAWTWIRRIIFYAALLALWQLVVTFQVWPDYVVPGPVTVLQSLIGGIRGGTYVQGTLVSLERLAIGYVISLVLGTILGLLLGRFAVLKETVGSLILGLQTLPSICWLPLAILWIGLNDQAIIFVVVMGALFSITLGVEDGIKNIPPVYLKAARTLGAKEFSVAWQVIVPAAMPSILQGFKQGWTFAWRSLMAGELLYFTLSLGNLLEAGRDLNDVAQVMSVIVIIIAIGILIDALFFATFERRLRERRGLVR